MHGGGWSLCDNVNSFIALEIVPSQPLLSHDITMDAWKDLCLKAFDGDEEANHVILFLEGCGKLTSTGYAVSAAAASSNKPKDEELLEALGFVKDDGTIYTLPGDQWSQYLESRRHWRMEWHADRQREFARQLHECLAEVKPLSTGAVSDPQRLALVTEFAQRFATDVGSIPLFRGLVGFIRYQLFKNRLAEWRCYEYALTQNGHDTIVEYVRFLKGVLGLELVYPPTTQQSSQSANNGDVILDVQEEPNQPRDDDVPVLIWRMNGQLSDHHLSDILRVLPREQGIQQYSLSDIPRHSHMSPIMGIHHPQLFIQWICQFLHHCFRSIFSSRK